MQTNKDRCALGMAIASNLREQSEADYREGTRLRVLADQLETGARDKLSKAEDYESTSGDRGADFGVRRMGANVGGLSVTLSYWAAGAALIVLAVTDNLTAALGLLIVGGAFALRAILSLIGSLIAGSAAGSQ